MSFVHVSIPCYFFVINSKKKIIMIRNQHSNVIFLTFNSTLNHYFSSRLSFFCIFMVQLRCDFFHVYMMKIILLLFLLRFCSIKYSFFIIYFTIFFSHPSIFFIFFCVMNCMYCRKNTRKLYYHRFPFASILYFYFLHLFLLVILI